MLPGVPITSLRSTAQGLVWPLPWQVVSYGLLLQRPCLSRGLPLPDVLGNNTFMKERRRSVLRSPDSWTSCLTGTAPPNRTSSDLIPSVHAMAVARVDDKSAYLDLKNAVEVEDKLTRALDAVQAHSDRLKEKKEAGGF